MCSSDPTAVCAQCHCTELLSALRGHCWAHLTLATQPNNSIPSGYEVDSHRLLLGSQCFSSLQLASSPPVRHLASQNSALLVYYTANSSICLRNVWVQAFVYINRVLFKMGPMVVPETSVTNYHYSLCNTPEECSSYPIASDVFSAIQLGQAHVGVSHSQPYCYVTRTFVTMRTANKT